MWRVDYGQVTLGGCPVILQAGGRLTRKGRLVIAGIAVATTHSTAIGTVGCVISLAVSLA